MQAPTDVRASAKTLPTDRQIGTVHFNNIPQVFTCKCDRIYHVKPGERGKNSAVRTRARELNGVHVLACLPLSEIPPQILHLAAGVEFRRDKVILYTRR